MSLHRIVDLQRHTRRELIRLGVGMSAAAMSARTWAAADSESDLDGAGMPYRSFDGMPFDAVDVAAARIRVAFGPGAFELPRERIIDYVAQSARSVAGYFGRFPAPSTRLLILNTTAPGRAVRSGTTFGYGGAAIRLTLAAGVTAADLDRDWILVHEMTHIALPSLPRKQHWFEEGMATYVEPLARAQAGRLGIEGVWADMIRGMPEGLPRPGDRGLDGTPTWGRTYWGGAMFCLLSDVEIREATAGQRGLQHALRAILDHANIEQNSTIEPLLQIGDRATGSTVLTSLYERMKGSPYPVDLNAVWRRLGVSLVDARRVEFDDTAPLAAIRKALTAAIKA